MSQFFTPSALTGQTSKELFALADAAQALRAPCKVYSKTFADERATEDAKQLCAHCPLLWGCRDFGWRTQQFGVWGGWDDADRARERRRIKAAAARAREHAKREAALQAQGHTLDDELFAAMQEAS